ncbi:MAG: glycerophosphodiester phosphodiesterase [Clostridia bacterium]|nr:glycerophosphodiester phosphodiesterase [Clostridia bacterium]
MSEVMIQAHRGASAYAPENTLPAFKLAVEMGADGIECDIHLSKDGRFIVCHDETVDRTSDGTGSIPSMTLEEIKKLDFGKKTDACFSGTQAPTLEEMLDVVKVMKVINIEIKRFEHEMGLDASLNMFYDIVVSYGILEKTIVSSFDKIALKRLKELHPDVYTCLLYSSLKSPASTAQKIGCSAIHPHFSYLTKATVNSAHKRGLKVNCWTVDDPGDIRRMIKIGCDGIISNKPDVALNIRDGKA